MAESVDVERGRAAIAALEASLDAEDDAVARFALCRLVARYHLAQAEGALERLRKVGELARWHVARAGEFATLAIEAGRGVAELGDARALDEPAPAADVAPEPDDYDVEAFARRRVGLPMPSRPRWEAELSVWDVGGGRW